MVRRVLSRSWGKEEERRDEEEVGRTRVVVDGVVERRRGMRSRPMLPEPEVMRIDLGGIFGILVFFSGLMVVVPDFVCPSGLVQRCCCVGIRCF